MNSDFKTNIQRRKRAKAKKELGRKRLLLTAGLILGFYLLFLFGKLHWMNYQMQHSLSHIEAENRRLRKTYTAKTEEKKKLQSVEYMKSIARKKLFLMERNEVPIKIMEKPRETPEQ